MSTSNDRELMRCDAGFFDEAGQVRIGYKVLNNYTHLVSMLQEKGVGVTAICDPAVGRVTSVAVGQTTDGKLSGPGIARGFGARSWRYTGMLNDGQF